MKIAIHHRSGGFSDRWITYCQEEGIDYKIVNCYDSDIIEQLIDCDSLIELTFRWCKPVTISMHRLNVMGGLV